MTTAQVLLGPDRDLAIATIREKHYTRSVSSGKTHYVGFLGAIVSWSIPANKNIARFLLGFDGSVWELSRLWAPDGHDKNLLTMAISAATKQIVRLERPDALVSYADPNAGHSGGVYRAASWQYDGQSEESRCYRSPDGTLVSRRAFHSGGSSMTKGQILALGYTQENKPGKQRFIRALSSRAKKAFAARKGLHRD